MGFFKLGKKKPADVELSEKTAQTQAAAPFTPTAPRWPGSLASQPGSTTDLTSEFSTSNYQDVKCDVMAQWLHSKQEEKIWTTGDAGEGVLVKKSKGNYAFSPAELLDDGTGLYQAVAAMNVRVCLHPTATSIATGRADY
jgi:hypothetical protein